jgi:hypothetical protein
MTETGITIGVQAALNLVLLIAAAVLTVRSRRLKDAADSWRKDFEYIRASSGEPATDEVSRNEEATWPGMYGH